MGEQNEHNETSGAQKPTLTREDGILMRHPMKGDPMSNLPKEPPSPPPQPKPGSDGDVKSGEGHE